MTPGTLVRPVRVLDRLWKSPELTDLRMLECEFHEGSTLLIIAVRQVTSHGRPRDNLVPWCMVLTEDGDVGWASVEEFEEVR